MNRERIYAKYDGRCAYCGTKLRHRDMQVDHIIPKAFGGGNEESNLAPACRQCNYYKTANPLDVFRKQMMTLHERVIDTFIVRLAMKYGIVKIIPWDGVFYRLEDVVYPFTDGTPLEYVDMSHIINYQ